MLDHQIQESTVSVRIARSASNSFSYLSPPNRNSKPLQSSSIDAHLRGVVNSQ